jgi:HlyD family secretion protein
VWLAALKKRVTPMVESTVMYVSADTVSGRDPQSLADPHAQGRGSFIVRVRLDDRDVKSKVADFRASPGMPADTFIRTAERTFLDYMLSPVRDSFNRAFRES